MISFLLLILFAQDTDDIRLYRDLNYEERMGLIIELIRDDKLENAISLAGEPKLKGYIMVLQGEYYESMEYVKKAALKGDISSCLLFLLFKMGVQEDDLKSYVEVELGLDLKIAPVSDLTRYLIFSPDSLYIDTNINDSILIPFVIFDEAKECIGDTPERAREKFERLLEDYPESITSIIARNLYRIVESN